MKLNDKQRRFVEEYLVDLNGTQAAIRAGYSKKTARQQAARLLSNVNIQEAIQKGADRRSERTEITQDMVLRELAVLAFNTLGDYITINEFGKPVLNIADLPAEKLGAVREITQRMILGSDDDDVGAVQETTLKLYDKRAALVDIGRHLGMFKDKVELGGDGWAEIMALIAGKSTPLVKDGGG